MADGPPPPPPPHGANPRPPGGLPDGNYDIFIIPPHSSGSGFLYLPSLQVQRNSFLAGVACTLLAVGVWTLAMPVLKQWLATLMASGGVGVVLLVMGVGVAGWAFGKTQGESGGSPGPGGSGATGSQQQSSSAPPPHSNGYAPPPKAGPYDPPPQANGYAPPPNANAWGSAPPHSPPQPEPGPPPQSSPKPKPAADAQTGWEKAREETRRREEERKRAAELQKKRDEAQRLREEAEKAAKAKAEKEKWEQARAREKEQREREARERIARDRLAREKEQREKDAREREAREKADKEKAAAAAKRASPTKSNISATYQRPSAKSYAGTDSPEPEHSFRPYDKPASSKPASRPTYKSSASSISGLSESSYAPSATTARTTPPASQRGPYTTLDEDKVIIKAVYLFSDSFPGKPLASLLSNQGSVTDGLILRIKTEGLFIDDDVRGVPQREWDVKAWTLKLVEDGKAKVGGQVLHVLRATVRDAENKRYTFVLEEGEAWKVALGLGRLKKGSQVRALGMNGLKEAEVVRLLGTLGWT